MYFRVQRLENSFRDTGSAWAPTLTLGTLPQLKSVIPRAPFDISHCVQLLPSNNLKTFGARRLS